MTSSQPSEIDQLLASELCSPLPPRRLFFTYVMNVIAFAFSALALIPLFSILWEIITRGIIGLKAEMFVKSVIDNGFGNAILGTITVVALGSLFSIPIGLFTGIFLAEFGQTSPLARFVRFIVSILTGVPSIVVGIFAYGLIVLATKQFSAIAGGFALATIMLPIIALTTEEALKLIPIDQRLASAALGGTRFQTTIRIVVTAAIPAITTGILLAVARAAGETAPLIFTALFSLDWSAGLLGPTASLPVLIYNLYNDPDPQKNQLVWTTSIVLLGLVLSFSLLSRLVTRKKKIK
ncbi:phosphate ABC transporter membrane protein 2, PhoT family [Trichormus variabilis ATCC 29413]|uniref:Phosphate transport system permease protein PstA n=2 Tax=Anabaena variabilis TaxID=264691 RepID=Q3M4H4_TRIV2|nr:MULTISPECIES: phosphate ABC transporter permease PstA [Nostocaceae]ABA24112.1 phosphate ABC transporter membrane protein 2, PhoT family [Trichormus variabilis ATCC 29413]MBC1217445.1 phosphate ABC transporter permease PstA [Trichormus variabilis ARAD]MBC1258378.1 phosphate ABC transporter permease PstA [Trichormus variabilis V5]MBC1269425.1 phosphate ABC transporter permease PstA [Trichormus variabilis FSR]MBC1305033.1 phosphate ABC transporter permease PstA [Trichormus variabilis N2B]